MTQFLGEAAPLEAYLKSTHRFSEDAVHDMTKAVADTAYDAWLASHEHRGAIRLPASRVCRDELERLEAAIMKTVQYVILGRLFGKAEDPDGFCHGPCSG